MKKLSVWSPRPNALPVENLSASVSIYGLPILNITPTPLSDKDIEVTLSADAFFYVSQYAVTSLFTQISTEELTDKIHIAIGEKTAETLSAIGITPTFVTKPPFNSESLLVDKTFKALPFKHLALISGQSGRRLLEKTLSEQGKKVSRIITYRRDKRNLSPKVMVEFLSAHKINAVMLTSCAIVDAVANQLQGGVASDVWHFPAFVFSQRIADYAKKIGFTQIIVVGSANRLTLYDRIAGWHDSE